MKLKYHKLFSLGFLFIFLFFPLKGGVIFQDFEKEKNYGDSYTQEKYLSHFTRFKGGEISLSSSKVKQGKTSLLTMAHKKWNEVSIFSLPHAEMPSFLNAFTFYMFSITQNDAPNNLGITFYDQRRYKNGFVLWTEKTYSPDQWHQIVIWRSQLPKDFDWPTFNEVKIAQYWPGNYYYDLFAFERKDLVFQSFELNNMANPKVHEKHCWDFGNKDEGVYFHNSSFTPFGNSCWKLTLKQPWRGMGLGNENKFPLPRSPKPEEERSFWHVNFMREFHDHLSFWVYAKPRSSNSRKVVVQLFDQGKHHALETQVNIRTNNTFTEGKWCRLDAYFSEVPSSFDFTSVDKIQFIFPDAGTYFIDQITVGAPLPRNLKFKTISLPQVEWSFQKTFKNHNYLFRAQWSPNKKEENWHPLYWGKEYSFLASRLHHGYIRVRAEELSKSGKLQYGVSDWSLPYSILQDPTSESLP